MIDIHTPLTEYRDLLKKHLDAVELILSKRQLFVTADLQPVRINSTTPINTSPLFEQTHFPLGGKEPAKKEIQLEQTWFPSEQKKEKLSPQKREQFNLICEQLTKGETLYTACNIAGVSRATYYNWQRKLSEPANDENIKAAITTAKIAAITTTKNTRKPSISAAYTRNPDSVKVISYKPRTDQLGTDPRGTAVIRVGKDTTIEVPAAKTEETIKKWRSRIQKWNDEAEADRKENIG